MSPAPRVRTPDCSVETLVADAIIASVGDAE